MRHSFSRARRGRALFFVLLAALVLVAGSLAAGGAKTRTGDEDPGFQGENKKVKAVDARKGRKAPNAKQRDIVDDRNLSVTFNRFGTPNTVSKPGGFVATGLPDEPVTAARVWIKRNQELLRLSDEGVENLDLITEAPLGESGAASVLFRQRIGGLPAGNDGQITLGVRDGNVAFVSTSLTPDTDLASRPTLSPADAFRAAAANLGRQVAPGDISVVGEEDGWTLLEVNGFTGVQRVRLVAVPTPEDGVRAAYEVQLIDTNEDLGFLGCLD